MKQPKQKEATSASEIKRLSYFMSKMDKLTNTPAEIDNYVEVLGKQLYFAVVKGKCSLKLKNTSDALFFCTDEELVYDNYYADFGPLNISCLFKFCCRVRKLLSFSRGMKSVVYYTCSQLEMKTNAACLMGCFSVIYLGFHPNEIWKILQQLSPYKPYIDASQISCGFHLCILDVLQAVHKAVQFNFFNFNDFNVSEYDLYDRLQYGDINWLLPRKFLAFIGPSDSNQAHPAEYYLKYFLKNDVNFRNAGIQHYDLIFPDGTTPPREILLHFLTIAEMGPGAVAVHCKAGLGRTGSLIGAYLIKHYHMTAREAIGWMRLCRPGSWPLDRERILAEARKKIQLNRLRLDFGKTSPQYNDPNYDSDTESLSSKDANSPGRSLKKSRKMTRNPQNWNTNRQKHKVASGMEHKYKNKIIPAKTIAMPCTDSCLLILMKISVKP
nr:unnamed protein product [Callosobruchus chinensis]